MPRGQPRSVSLRMRIGNLRVNFHWVRNGQLEYYGDCFKKLDLSYLLLASVADQN